MPMKIADILSEKQFQQQILDLAKLRGWKTYHPYDSRHSTAGWPDVTLVKDGRLIFWEVKSAKGRVSEEQAQWLVALALTGCEARVVRPADWDYIVEALR